jgi:hypothetical protein
VLKDLDAKPDKTSVRLPRGEVVERINFAKRREMANVCQQALRFQARVPAPEHVQENLELQAWIEEQIDAAGVYGQQWFMSKAADLQRCEEAKVGIVLPPFISRILPTQKQAPVTSMELRKVPEIPELVVPVVEALKVPAKPPSDSRQPTSPVSKPTARSRRAMPGIPPPDHFIESEGQQDAPVAMADTRCGDEDADLIGKDGSGSVNGSNEHRSLSSYGDAHLDNGNTSLQKENLPDSVTLSDLLGIGRTWVCNLRNSSAANLANALHHVRGLPDCGMFR